MRALFAVLALSALLVGLLLWLPFGGEPLDVDVVSNTRTGAGADTKADASMQSPLASHIASVERRARMAKATLEEGDAPSQTGEAPLFTLTASFVDERGRPVPDVHVYLERLGDEEPLLVGSQSGRLVEARVRSTPALESALEPLPGLSDLRLKTATKTHAGKRLIARGRWGHQQRFALVAPGKFRLTSPVDVYRGTSINLGTVVLLDASLLTGRVVDQTGAPLSRVHVEPLAGVNSSAAGPHVDGDPNVSELASWSIPSDAHGRYRVRGVPYELDLKPEMVDVREFTPLGQGPSFRVAAGNAQHALDLTVAMNVAGRSYAGKVLLPNREPAAGARVMVHLSDPTLGVVNRFVGSVDCEPDGSFRFLGDVSETVFAKLSASIPGAAYWPETAARVEQGTRDVELILGAPRRFDLVVVDGSGEPVPWAQARLQATSRCSGWQATDELVPLGREGRATLAAPPCGVRLRIFAPGYADSVQDYSEPISHGEVLRVVLQAAPSVRGRITHKGRPVAGARVGLLRGFEDGKPRATFGNTDGLDPFGVLFPPQDDHHDATTDSDGAFVATPQNGTWFHLVVRKEGFPRSVGAAFEFDPQRGTFVEFELELAGSLGGMTTGGEEGDLQRKMIGVSNGTGIVRVSTISEDGGWLVEDLQPGDWQVRVLAAPFLGGERLKAQPKFERYGIGRSDEYEARVYPGQTSGYTVDLGGIAKHDVGGLILFSGPGDEELRAIGLELVPLIEGRLARLRGIASSIAQDGSFSFQTPLSGPHCLVFGPGGSWIAGPFDVRAGLAPIDLEVGVARARIRWSHSIDAAQGSFEQRRRAYLFARSPAGVAQLKVLLPPRGEDPGDQTLLVPAGRLQVAEESDAGLLLDRADQDPLAGELLFEADIAAGAIPIIDLD